MFYISHPFETKQYKINDRLIFFSIFSRHCARQRNLSYVSTVSFAFFFLLCRCFLSLSFKWSRKDDIYLTRYSPCSILFHLIVLFLHTLFCSSSLFSLFRFRVRTLHAHIKNNESHCIKLLSLLIYFFNVFA